MELQENGLPIGAEFVGLLRPQKGQYFVQGEDCVIATYDWEYWIKVIVSFPTYGKPLEQVDLKGSKLLGRSMKTAYGRAEPGQTFINADGDVMKIPSNSCTTTASFIRLEPLPKKRKVLVVEIPVTERDTVNLRTGPREFDYSGFSLAHLMKFAGGTIKEIDDAE